MKGAYARLARAESMFMMLLVRLSECRLTEEQTNEQQAPAAGDP